MPTNPPENMPRITPYLYYKDVARSLSGISFGERRTNSLRGFNGL